MLVPCLRRLSAKFDLSTAVLARLGLVCSDGSEVRQPAFSTNYGQIGFRSGDFPASGIVQTCAAGPSSVKAWAITRSFTGGSFTAVSALQLFCGGAGQEVAGTTAPPGYTPVEQTFSCAAG